MASDSAGASPIVIGHYLASGIAICAGTPGNCGQPDKPDDPIDVAVQPVQGELVRLGLGPYKQGASRGTLVFKPKSDKCSPSVSVPWGRSR